MRMVGVVSYMTVAVYQNETFHASDRYIIYRYLVYHIQINHLLIDHLQIH